MPRGCLRRRREELWEETRRRLREVLEKTVPSVDELFAERGEPLLRAVAGNIAGVFAKLERMLVTRFGMNSWYLVEPWFWSCRRLGKPWDMVCECNHRTYTVKVVVSTRAFNSTLRRRIEEEAENMHNPVILTLTGMFEDGERHEQSIGRAVWMDAVATWEWLTGDKWGYRTFLHILFEEGRPIRRLLLDRIYEEYRRQKERGGRSA